MSKKIFEIQFTVYEKPFRQLCVEEGWFRDLQASDYDEILNKLRPDLTIVDLVRLAELVQEDQKDCIYRRDLSFLMYLIIDKAGCVYFKEVRAPKKPKTLREKLRNYFKK